MAEIIPQADAAADRATPLGPFPALRQLGLGPAELDALRSQGYLHQDERGHGHLGYWRLRFRCNQRLRTIYLGRDQQVLEQVRNELGMLQSDRVRQKRLVQVAKQVRKDFRDAKKRLAGVLQQHGMHYHGDAIRKTRSHRKVAD